MGNRNKTDTVYCFNAETGGEPIWKQEYPCSGGQHPGPRCSPTIDGGLVYTLSTEGHLLCMDAAKGEVVWRKHGVADFGGQAGSWGFACSPMVLGDALIVDVGVVVAVNKKTGELIWKSKKYRAGYSSPEVVQMGGRRCLPTFNASGLVILDAANGQELAAYPWKTDYDVNASMPVVSGDRIFITTDYGRGCAVVEFTGAGLKEVWQNKAMASHFATPILLDGYLYGCDGNVGRGPLKCLEFATGREMWSHKAAGGSFILVGGKLILLETRGRLAVVEPSPAEYKELTSTDLGKGTWWPAPVLCGGRIYCRSHEGQLVCLDVSGGK